MCYFTLFHFNFVFLIHSSVHNSGKYQEIRKVLKISKNTIKSNSPLLRLCPKNLHLSPWGTCYCRIPLGRENDFPLRKINRFESCLGMVLSRYPLLITLFWFHLFFQVASPPHAICLSLTFGVVGQLLRLLFLL